MYQPRRRRKPTETDTSTMMQYYERDADRENGHNPVEHGPRRRRRFLPPLRTRLDKGPFPADGQRYTISEAGATLLVPSYMAAYGSAPMGFGCFSTASTDEDAATTPSKAKYYSSPSSAVEAPTPTTASSVGAPIAKASPSQRTLTSTDVAKTHNQIPSSLPPSATTVAVFSPDVAKTHNQSPLSLPPSNTTAGDASPVRVAAAPLSINWFSKESIDQHFPFQRTFGRRLPPIHWRGSESRMRCWRKLNKEEQEEEWARWNALSPGVKKGCVKALEQIQMGIGSNEEPRLKKQVALTLSIEVQTDQTLLDMRDEPDDVIIERLTKRTRVEDEVEASKLPAAAATAAPASSAAEDNGKPSRAGASSTTTRPTTPPNRKTSMPPPAPPQTLKGGISDYERIQREESHRHMIRFLS